MEYEETGRKHGFRQLIVIIKVILDIEHSAMRPLGEGVAE
jgi:hypothetical protein